MQYIIFFNKNIFKNKNIIYAKSIINRKVGISMIDFTPFWKTLKNSNETYYSLTNKHKISFSTLNKLKHNKGITTQKLNDLCRILKCDVSDICRYVPSDEDQQL